MFSSVATLYALVGALFVFLVVVVHIIMALAVNGDAKRLSNARVGLFLFGPLVWGLVVLVFGLAGLGVYWGIHHSTLRPRPESPERKV